MPGRLVLPKRDMLRIEFLGLCNIQFLSCPLSSKVSEIYAILEEEKYVISLLVMNSCPSGQSHLTSL
jgi:hypothetical protein